jgi:hypothetical protein
MANKWRLGAKPGATPGFVPRRHLTYREIGPKSPLNFKSLEGTISLWVSVTFRDALLPTSSAPSS